MVGVGAAVGALNLAHYELTSRMAGFEVPFGLFPGGVPVASLWALTGRGLSRQMVAVLVLGAGILAGAAFAAWRSGELSLAHWRAEPLTPRTTGQAIAAGLLMGSGIWMAQGCLIKHALSGVPGLMLSSWLTVAGIAGGLWLAAKLTAGRS